MYAGVGVGGSFLQANTSGIDLSQDNSTSTAGQLIVGANLNSMFALEGRLGDFGTVKFTDGTELGYQVADVSGLYKYNRNKFNAYARAGVGTLSSTGDYETRLENPVHAVVGAGFGYQLNPRISLRAEWMGHDIDVSHAQLSLVYHFNQRLRTGLQEPQSVSTLSAEPKTNQKQERGLIIEPIAKLSVPTIDPVTPKLNVEPEIKTQPISQRPIISKPAVESNSAAVRKPATQAESALVQNNADTSEKIALKSPQSSSLDGKQIASIATVQKTVPTEPDMDQDGIIDALDKCPGSKDRRAVAPDGCSLFSRAVPGLTFWPNTDRLQSSAETVLDSVAVVLKEQPDMRLTVAAYTAQSADAQAALFLTRRRIIAITRYLSSQGIDATRLRPEVLSDANAQRTAINRDDIEQVMLTPR